MSQRNIAGKTIDVNEEGYLTNLIQWNREIGTELASEAQIEMSPRHWQVIDYL